MTPLSALSLTLLLMSAPAPNAAQDEIASVATLHLADGTSVALVEWTLTYEFTTWRPKEPVSMAKPQVRESGGVVLGKKTYPVKADTLTLTHEQLANELGTARVVVSRLLKQLEENGTVRLGRNKIMLV